MGIKIAVIDNAVDEPRLPHPLAGCVCIGKAPAQAGAGGGAGGTLASHGTMCAAILQKYCPSAEIYAVSVLDVTGRGMVADMEDALEWCAANGVDIASLSLGTTHFKDRAAITAAVNRHANAGLVVVAAMANSGYRTYPASLSNAIGVAASGARNAAGILAMQNGADILAPAEHEVLLDGGSLVTPGSNSFAAPYVSARAAGILEGGCAHDVCAVLERLKSGQAGRMPFFEPDWMSTAWVSKKCKRSLAQFCFEEAECDSPADCLGEIDTVAVCGSDEYMAYRGLDRHMVFIGDGEVQQPSKDRHFWSRAVRVEQILGCASAPAEIDVPIVAIDAADGLDLPLWLCTLRDSMADGGYNAYAACCVEACVLYGLEFLPEELCQSRMDRVWDFLYWQAYFDQADAILFASRPGAGLLPAGWRERADIVAEVSREGDMLRVRILCDGESVEDRRMQCGQRGAAEWLADAAVSLLTGGQDGQ